jgi:hypothetical protein
MMHRQKVASWMLLFFQVSHLSLVTFLLVDGVSLPLLWVMTDLLNHHLSKQYYIHH